MTDEASEFTISLVPDDANATAFNALFSSEPPSVLTESDDKNTAYFHEAGVWAGRSNSHGN